MLYVLLNIAIAISAFIAMEFVAWFTHRFIMHGLLWILHRDHHVPHKGHLEKNDLFVLFFAAPAVLALVAGIANGWWPLISAGIGITLYGVAYTLFHDIMFHRRVSWLKLKAFSPYLRRIVNAHRSHHQTTGKSPGQAYGFLWAPKRYETLTGKEERPKPITK